MAVVAAAKIMSAAGGTPHMALVSGLPVVRLLAGPSALDVTLELRKEGGQEGGQEGRQGRESRQREQGERKVQEGREIGPLLLLEGPQKRRSDEWENGRGGDDRRRSGHRDRDRGRETDRPRDRDSGRGWDRDRGWGADARRQGYRERDRDGGREWGGRDDGEGARWGDGDSADGAPFSCNGSARRCEGASGVFGCVVPHRSVHDT